MNLKTRTEVIPANGRLELGPANFIFLIATGAAVNVQFYTRSGGNISAAEGVQGGFVQGKTENWRNAAIVGTAGVSVTFIYGDADLQEDITDYRRTVGVFQPQQSTAFADTADVDVGGSAVAILIAPANAARKKGTVRVLTGAAVAIRVGTQATIAAGRGLQLNENDSYSFESTAALYAIREAAGVALTCHIDENY